MDGYWGKIPKIRYQTHKPKLQNKAEKGYRWLFINLGEGDRFYPGELMQTLNRFLGWRQVVGHIDLLGTISYFEVEEKDAKKVNLQLTGIRYKGRTMRCNEADEGGKKGFDSIDKPKRKPNHQKKDEWCNLMNKVSLYLRGPEPDLSKEGWAKSKPRKKR